MFQLFYGLASKIKKSTQIRKAFFCSRVYKLAFYEGA